MNKRSVQIVKNLLKAAFDKERFGLIAAANERLKRVHDMPAGHAQSLEAIRKFEKAAPPERGLFN